MQSVLAHSQMIAVKLKNPTIAALLKSQNLKRPILMHKVRWNWTYLNLDRMLELKSFCQQNDTIKSLKVPEAVWTKIHDLRDSLKPVFELTLALQVSNLTIPDMVFKWHSKKLVLKSLKSSYSANLFTSIENREHQIFSKPIVIASMFLDKRFSELLSNDEVGIAKNAINKIQKRIEGLANNSFEESSVPVVTYVDETPLNEEAAMLEEMLRQRSSNIETEKVDDTTADALAVELRHYTDQKRFRADTNIMEFWKNHKSAFPLLSKIALMILTIPVTEVDVERLFSHLSFIHSKLRNCLTSEMISNILFLRLSSKQTFENMSEEVLF